MPGALELLQLFSRKLEAERLPRVSCGMMDPQAHKRGLGHLVQRVISGAHISKVGVRSDWRYQTSGQHGITARGILERGVRVPKSITERDHTRPVVGGADLSVRIEIGTVGDSLVAEAVLGHDGDRGFCVQRTVETFRECQLFVVGELLVTNYHESISGHAATPEFKVFRVRQIPQVRSDNLSGEMRGQFPDRKRFGFLKRGHGLFLKITRLIVEFSLGFEIRRCRRPLTPTHILRTVHPRSVAAHESLPDPLEMQKTLASRKKYF